MIDVASVESIFKDPGWRLRQEKGWVRRACEPPLHYRKIHQNYSQTSLKVSSFNLRIKKFSYIVPLSIHTYPSKT